MRNICFKASSILKGRSIVDTPVASEFLLEHLNWGKEVRMDMFSPWDDSCRYLQVRSARTFGLTGYMPR